MPVVTLDMSRFSRLVGAEKDKILDRLPFVGLDIEGQSEDLVRVEYSPNRPDFGTDYGIAKALRGIMGIEVGMRRYGATPSHIVVRVEPSVSSVRPFIACAAISDLHLDEEDVRQVISLQEDLHNGLGRRRRRVAVGLHDLKAMAPPIVYKAVRPSSQFVPLDEGREMTLSEILTSTETGRTFAHTLAGAKEYPLLVDSKRLPFSFPPIINCEATRVTSRTQTLFVEVTSTDMKAGDDVLAVLVTTLADMGGRLCSVGVDYDGKKRTTPDLRVSRMKLDSGLIQRVTGLKLTSGQIKTCIRRSRLGVKGAAVLVPRYRLDILHPVDIAEEVALGYGFDRIDAIYPPSKQPGAFNPCSQFLERASDVMSFSGMIELMTYELLDEKSLYRNFARPPAAAIAVEGPKSAEHSLLRDSVIPSLMAAMASNVKEEYPQRVFEIGRVYRRTKRGVEESWQLGCLAAHAQASFSEAKMFLASFVRTILGRSIGTEPAPHWAFAPGRSATVRIGDQAIGSVGEVSPVAISAFDLNTPVCGFEIDLSVLSKQLK